MNVTLVNLTPHDPLNIWDGDRVVLSIPRGGVAARCAEVEVPRPSLLVDGLSLPVVTLSYGEVSGLPAPEPGTAYVVSQLVVLAEPDRTDLYFPADLRRDASGTIVGCGKLARLS